MFSRGIYIDDKMKIEIREYNEDYFSDLTSLFWEVVHSVNADDYIKNQLDTWAPLQIDIEKWKIELKITL